MSQLTFRPVSMTVNPHCFIQLNLGMVSHAVIPGQYKQPLHVPHFLLVIEGTLGHDRYDPGLHEAYIVYGNRQ